MSSFDSSVPWIPSPNFSSRQGCRPLATLLHYTASNCGPDRSAAGDIGWFQDPASRVSSHFLVDRLGASTQMVDLAMAAWHAGPSEMCVDSKVLRGCNLFTIGIEIDNIGYLYRGNSGKFFYEAGGHMFAWKGVQPVHATLVYDHGIRLDGWWEPYPEAQIQGVLRLLEKLRHAGYADAVSNCIGHEEVCTPIGRKSDPGPLFPWGLFPRMTTRRTSAILV